jgi:homoserine trans-succinylase
MTDLAEQLKTREESGIRDQESGIRNQGSGIYFQNTKTARQNYGFKTFSTRELIFWLSFEVYTTDPLLTSRT